MTQPAGHCASTPAADQLGCSGAGTLTGISLRRESIMKIKEYPSTDLTVQMTRNEGYSVLMALRGVRARALADRLGKDSVYVVNLAAVADRLDTELARAREACKDILLEGIDDL